MLIRQILLLLSGVLLFSACRKNNEKPVWISIDQWVLDPGDAPMDDLGQLSHNFSEVWIYVDNKIIGVFELPCKVPVLVSGNKKLQLYPAIRNNGFYATKKVYPFCKPVEMNVEFVPGQTYTYTPHTSYFNNVKCWKEDFSTNSFAIATNEDYSNATIQLGNDPAISMSPGNQYAQIHLTSSDSLWIGYTTGQLVLPAGKEVYLEIDYRNSNPLLTGVLGISGTEVKQNGNITITPQKPDNMVWKKIYIDLKEIVSYSTTADYFEIYLEALLDSGQSTGEIYIDNIKIVRFY